MREVMGIPITKVDRRGWRCGALSERDQQVVTKVTFHHIDTLPGHLRYLRRKGTASSECRAEPFGPAPRKPIEADTLVERWKKQRDRWHFRLVLSPSVFVDDFEEYIRRVMERVGFDIGEPEWFAFAHRDTEHQHAHIIIRGRVRDPYNSRRTPSYLFITKGYVATGFRSRAQEILTRECGWRTMRQIAQDNVRSQERKALRTQGRNIVIDAKEAGILDDHLSKRFLRIMERGAPTDIETALTWVNDLKVAATPPSPELPATIAEEDPNQQDEVLVVDCDPPQSVTPCAAPDDVVAVPDLPDTIRPRRWQWFREHLCHLLGL